MINAISLDIAPDCRYDNLMTSSRTAALALLAPVPRGAQTPASPDDARLRDEEAQLARLELSLAQAERAGEQGLMVRLTVLRHAQQGRVMEARRRAGDPSSFNEFLDRMKEWIEAAGMGGARGVCGVDLSR